MTQMEKSNGNKVKIGMALRHHTSVYKGRIMFKHILLILDSSALA